jgi:hypothetical protein
MKDFHRFEIEQCQQNPDMDGFASFTDIPDDRVSESSLVAWLVAGGKYKEIPQGLRSEALMWSAVRHDRDAYELIDETDVADHRGLSLEALKHDHAKFSSVPERHKDGQFIVDCTAYGHRKVLTIDFYRDYEHLLTEDVAKQICSRSISDASDFCTTGKHRACLLMKDEYLEAGIRVQTSDYPYLKLMGKTYVLAGMLAKGFWPDESQFAVPDETATFKTPPSSLTQALERLQVNQGAGHRLLHECWIKIHPMQEVVSAFEGSQNGLDALFRLYKQHELRDYIRTSRPLRGRFLEQELGM